MYDYAFFLLSFPRKLQCAAANSTSTNGENSLEINVVKPKEEVVDPLYSEKKIRCPCGSSLSTEYMIQVIPSSFVVGWAFVIHFPSYIRLVLALYPKPRQGVGDLEYVKQLRI